MSCFTGIAQDRIANVLLAYKSKSSYGGPARAAEDLARNTARDLLGPLLDTACARLGFVLRRVLDLSADRGMQLCKWEALGDRERLCV